MKSKTFLGLAGLLFLLSCMGEERPHLQQLTYGPNEQFYAKIQYFDPGSAFGPHKMEVWVAKAKDNEVKVLDYDLKNDGANLSENNAVLKWLGNESFSVTFTGEEQDQKLFMVSHYDGQWTAKEVK